MLPDPSTPVRDRTTPERWLNEHGDHLYRFALARVSSPDSAEDLVQETLLAALTAAASFAGQSSERTWLIAILKHKVVDWLRHVRKTRLCASLSDKDELVDDYYDRAGHGQMGPREWGCDPATLLERREFREALRQCLVCLPDRLREVFSLRVLDDLPADEVCQVLKISATNLWTLMHRARVRLLQCLERTGPRDRLGKIAVGGSDA
jgi:RNA polymerase sigma-70 factor, ECF subfamily